MNEYEVRRIVRAEIEADHLRRNGGCGAMLASFFAMAFVVGMVWLITDGLDRRFRAIEATAGHEQKPQRATP